MKTLFSKHLLMVASFSTIAILSGCTSIYPTTQSINDRIQTRVGGNYVDGKDSIEGSDFAFFIGWEQGVAVTEIDGKPFFVEYKSGSKWIKAASPIKLQNSAFVIRPGPHTVSLKYVSSTQWDLFGNYVDYSKDEVTLEFIAEKEHGYLVEAKVTSNPKLGKYRLTREIPGIGTMSYAPSDKYWNPTIRDLDAPNK